MKRVAAVPLAVLTACGAPPAEPPRPDPGTSEAPPTVSVASARPPIAQPVVDVEPAPAPHSEGRRLRVRTQDRASSMLGPEIEAPCDFSRLYRGGVGKESEVSIGNATQMSVALQKSPNGTLSGTIRYDRAGAVMPIAGGSAKPDGSFQLTEKGAGTFVGRCNEAGVLSGTFTHRNKKQPFTWFPRPQHWPALHRHTQTKKVKTCEVHATTIRYFGGSAAINQAVNRSLDPGLFAGHVQDVGACPKRMLHESHSLVSFATADVVTIQTGTSSDYGGAHPMNSAGGSGTTVDLRTGRRVMLRDVVPSPEQLRPLMPACVRDYMESADVESGEVTVTLSESDVVCDAYPFANYLWGCDPNEKTPEPTWALVRGGIAILATGHGHAEAFRDGSGPIVSWAALLREGLLDPKSPVARLWQGVAPAEKRAPACVSGFKGYQLVHWSVLSP